MRFYGNEICCGSYACLNAIRDEKIDVQLFEISTSVPFGIRHCKDIHFDRLLTTYCDPNQGLDQALDLWGYNLKKYSAVTSEEAVDILKRVLKCSEAVIGPVDMGSLHYQVFPGLLKRMDHYVLVREWSEEEVLCIDSEGICGRVLSYKELQKCISVKEVPEARGAIWIRMITKREDWQLGRILNRSYKAALQNLKSAEADSQGSKAIENCYEFLEDSDIYQWKLPFLYDLEYLVQRKGLFLCLIDQVSKRDDINVRKTETAGKIVQTQKNLLGEIYKELKFNNQIWKRQFQELKALEYELASL